MISDFCVDLQGPGEAFEDMERMSLSGETPLGEAKTKDPTPTTTKTGDLSRICDIIAHDLERIHVSYYNSDAKRTKGMYRQRTQKTWGHTTRRGWAQYLIIHGLAHCGANGNADGRYRPGRPILL